MPLEIHSFELISEIDSSHILVKIHTAMYLLKIE